MDSRNGIKEMRRPDQILQCRYSYADPKSSEGMKLDDAQGIDKGKRTIYLIK
jgi:hypothetical protein